MRRIFALVIKEYLQILRDPSSILISVILPLILLFIYGSGISLDMKNLKTGVILEDLTSNATSFSDSITKSKFFQATVSANRLMIIDLLQNGHLNGFVTVPFYFSRYLEDKNLVAPIQVIGDGSDPNTASFIQNYINGAYLTWTQIQNKENGRKQTPLITADPRYWYNEDLDSHYFLIPGSIAIIMALIGTLLTALVMAREWERGTIEALMATPVKMIQIIWSKILSYFTLGIGSMIICAFIAIVVYEVPYRGSYWVLFFVSTAFLSAALGTGLVISTVAKNQFIASQASIITAFLPAFMLSGFIFEISSMPWPIRYLTYLFPVRYMVPCLQTLFLVGNVWSLILKNSFMMFGFAVLFFTILKLITVKRLD